MSRSQHKKTMEGLSKTIDEALQEMIGSEDYPNTTAAEHNDNYTSFTVTTKSEELGFNESFSVLSFTFMAECTILSMERLPITFMLISSTRHPAK